MMNWIHEMTRTSEAFMLFMVLLPICLTLAVLIYAGKKHSKHE